MSSQRSSADLSDDTLTWTEKRGLINDDPSLPRWGRRRFRPSTHVATLYLSNSILLIITLVLAIKLARRPYLDPTIGVYSPANGAIEYIKEKKFRPALFEKTPYMGYPTDETDKLWQDLYNFGITTISEEEAKLLPHPTLAIPGTKEYLVELDVWHQLHCLNDLRMLLYPERFPGLAGVTDANGTIDRETFEFRHWDHCVDSIREAIMCNADVSPVPFRVNVPSNKVIVPRLSTTHTCRNFTKIQEWAKSHQAPSWDFNVTPEQAQEIIKESGFDNGPWESIEDQYEFFPGDPFFKYWRDHPEEAKEARRKSAGGA